MLVGQQYRAWSDCMDVQAGLALYWWQRPNAFASSRIMVKIRFSKYINLYSLLKYITVDDTFSEEERQLRRHQREKYVARPRTPAVDQYAEPWVGLFSSLYVNSHQGTCLAIFWAKYGYHSLHKVVCFFPPISEKKIP